jgi:hypothetical protein
MTNIVNPSALVNRGVIQQEHPAARFFRAFLRGRKPSVIIAYYFLAHDIGMFLELHASLNLPDRLPKPRFRPAVPVTPRNSVNVPAAQVACPPTA